MPLTWSRLRYEETPDASESILSTGGAMAVHSPAYIGDAGVGMAAHIRKAIKEADVILCLNGRFGEAATGAWELLSVPNPVQKIIHSHASDAEIGKVYQPDILHLLH